MGLNFLAKYCDLRVCPISKQNICIKRYSENTSEADGNKETESYSAQWILQHLKKKSNDPPSFWEAVLIRINSTHSNGKDLRVSGDYSVLCHFLANYQEQQMCEVSFLSHLWPQIIHYKIFKYIATQNELVDTSLILSSIITVSEECFSSWDTVNF